MQTRTQDTTSNISLVVLVVMIITSLLATCVAVNRILNL